MGLKLYYGGFGEYQVYTVAEDEKTAIDNIGKKINAPYLPITAEEISEVDGYNIQPVFITSENADVVISKTETTIELGETATIETEKAEETEITSGNSIRHCKKCDFTCETQGELLKHYRENHAKGDS